LPLQVESDQSVQIEGPSRSIVAPVTLYVRQYMEHRDQKVITYHGFRGSFVVFATIFVIAFLTFADEQLFAANTRVAAAKAVTSNADNLYDTG
jgi:hypothetical protein